MSCRPVGDDFVVVAADTRLSQGYSIHTRDCSKVTQLTDKCVIASCGMKADAITLHKHLKARMVHTSACRLLPSTTWLHETFCMFQCAVRSLVEVMYEHQHRKQPSVTAIAQMLATTLYYKRFFPYYTFNVLCGIDDEGKGAVYHYDAIGSFERVPYTTSGSGSSLVMSVLDAQIAKGNQTIDTPPLDKRGIVELCKDVLSSVGERDIHTGDYGEIFLIDAAGISPTRFDLKLD